MRSLIHWLDVLINLRKDGRGAGESANDRMSAMQSSDEIPEKNLSQKEKH
jgi:hypothetical protein